MNMPAGDEVKLRNLLGSIPMAAPDDNLAHRGWLCERNGDGGWYTVAKLPTDPLLMTHGHICTPEETALYGVSYSENINEY